MKSPQITLTTTKRKGDKKMNYKKATKIIKIEEPALIFTHGPVNNPNFRIEMVIYDKSLNNDQTAAIFNTICTVVFSIPLCGDQFEKNNTPKNLLLYKKTPAYGVTKLSKDDKPAYKLCLVVYNDNYYYEDVSNGFFNVCKMLDKEIDV